MKKLRFAGAIALLISASLACSLLSPEAAPVNPPPTGAAPSDNAAPEGSLEKSAGPQAQATAAESGSPGVPATGEPLDLDSARFENPGAAINTYRTALFYGFTSSNGITGTLTMEGATQRTPFAADLRFKTAGMATAGLGVDFTYTHVADADYISSQEFGCQGGLENFALNPFELTLNTGGMLTGEARYLGEETVNGIPVQTYELTGENLNPADPARLGIRTLTEGRVSIAKDSGFPVRVTLTGEGINADLSGDPGLPGTIRYDLNTFDFNQPLSISIPEGCASPEETVDRMPLPDDARDITKFVDFVNFTTSLTMEELATFYEDRMPALGCSEPEVIGDGASMTAMTFYNCTFGSAQIIMTVEAGETSATIFLLP